MGALCGKTAVIEPEQVPEQVPEQEPSKPVPILQVVPMIIFIFLSKVFVEPVKVQFDMFCSFNKLLNI